MQDIIKDSYTLMLGDCLERMREIPDGSVDMVFADLPYGTTQCRWDVMIPFEPLWKEYWRVSKPAGVVALFGSEPFSSQLRNSQLEHFKYDWIWDKANPSGFQLAKKIPMKQHEIISVFYRTAGAYTPQTEPKAKPRKTRHYGKSSEVSPLRHVSAENHEVAVSYPKTILRFSNADRRNRLHPTQKPVDLLEYIIRSYTQPGQVVLDNTMGSGSAGVAALNTGRRFVGIEKELNYFEVAAKRMAESLAQSAGTTSGTPQTPAGPDDSAPSAHSVSAVPGNC